jgi:cytoskeletal protein CcmA (bactofilin family)
MIRKKNDSSDSQNGSGKLSPSINLISEGTELTGNLKSSHSIRISGTIHGSVEVDGKCILANVAVVKGDIHANEADISGSVSGDIHVLSKLVLRHTAHVFGNVQAKSISIEDGALFEGTCTMSANPVRKISETETDFNIRQITQAYRR